MKKALVLLLALALGLGLAACGGTQDGVNEEIALLRAEVAGLEGRVAALERAAQEAAEAAEAAESAGADAAGGEQGDAGQNEAGGGIDEASLAGEWLVDLDPNGFAQFVFYEGGTVDFYSGAYEAGYSRWTGSYSIEDDGVHLLLVEDFPEDPAEISMVVEAALENGQLRLSYVSGGMLNAYLQSAGDSLLLRPEFLEPLR